MQKATEETFRVAEATVLVRRKRVRNFNLRVAADGTVTMSCPTRATDKSIHDFLASHANWIAHAQRRIAERSVANPTAFLPGETLPVWGRDLPIETEAAPSTSARLAGEKVVLSLATGDGEPAALEARLAAVRALYEVLVAEALPGIASRCETVVGRCASRWRVRTMRTRWGSCNVRTASITINGALAQYPPECLEYVVTHELTHLWEPGHGARFHELMDGFCPSWREARKALSARAQVGL